MKKTAVVALGGNALLKGNEKGTIIQQEKNARAACFGMLNLLKKNYNIIITHGNGPQVGNILLRNEAGYSQFNIPQMPMDVCVADSQGGIGYMIERVLRNILTAEKIKRNIVSLITPVLVDKKDQAFRNPTKPIGPYYSPREKQQLEKTKGWKFKEDPRGWGWRKVVPSPEPKDILNKNTIQNLASSGNIVIAVGGGGVPISSDKNKNIKGVEAVIDKDKASSLLATQIKAEEFYIITDVPYAYVNFKKHNQKKITTINIKEIKKLIADEQFSAGSMKPKIVAAARFIENGGKTAVITNANELHKKNAGTRIIS